MAHYPAFLDLTGKILLVIGAGEVGVRKIAALLPCAPKRIDVVDPRPDIPALAACLERGPVVHLARPFQPEDVEGKSLVFAAADNRAVNALAASLCRERNIFCNVADAPEEGSFQAPALVRQGGITLAVSTGGQSPALAARMREELEIWAERYAGAAHVLGRLRPHVLALALSPEENAALFRRLARSSLAEDLSPGNAERAAALLKQLLPQALHHCIQEVLYEF